MFRRRSQLVAVAWAFSLAVNLATIASAVAQPTMTMTASTYIYDYDPDHPGLELLIQYTVRNTSTPGDIYNMISFTLPAGSQQGVCFVVPDFDMADWSFQVGEGSTFVDGTGIPLRPGRMGQIMILSTLLHVGQGEATAVAVGTTVPLPFKSVLVPVPGYHPLDRDQDADIDADDFAAFEACASGPAIPFIGDCAWADLDGDTDVDQADFGRFQPCLTAHGGSYIEGCETP